MQSPVLNTVRELGNGVAGVAFILPPCPNIICTDEKKSAVEMTVGRSNCPLSYVFYYSLEATRYRNANRPFCFPLSRACSTRCKSIVLEVTIERSVPDFFFLLIFRRMGWEKQSLSFSFSSPHFHVFSVVLCVNLTQLHSQSSASWRVLHACPTWCMCPSVPVVAMARAAPCFCASWKIIFIEMTNRYFLFSACLKYFSTRWKKLISN